MVSKRVLTISAILIAAIGVAAYLFHTPGPSERSGPHVLSAQATPIVTAPSPNQPQLSSTPLPPPRPGGEAINKPSPERERALVGASAEQIARIEQSLPPRSQVATYAVSNSEQRAAYATADLQGNGTVDTVVVYKEIGSDSLFLAVLASKDSSFTLRSSVRLNGGIIYGSIFDTQAVPFAVRDVTGDERPEIIVTSGVGASLGAALQIYSFDGSSLRQLAFAQGHTLHLDDGRAGKPAEITAQSRYEQKPRRYHWNGQVFAKT